MAEITEQIFDNKSHFSHKSYYIPMSYPFVYEGRHDKWETYKGIENGAAMRYLNLRDVHLWLTT